MINKLLSVKRTLAMRRWFYFVGDSSCITLAIYVAFLLRFDWKIPGAYNLLLYIPSILLIKLLVFWFFNLHNMSWTHTGPHEIVTITKANIVGSALVFLVIHVFNPAQFFTGFPRSIFVADFVLCVFFITGFRLLKRLYLHYTKGSFAFGKQTLIVGAGDAGVLLVKDMRHQNETTWAPLGFVDDDPGKQGIDVCGLRVLGKTNDIPELVEKLKIESILVAIPSAPSKVIQHIMEEIRKTPVRDIRVVPGVKRILEGTVTISDIKEIAIEDILGREEATVDTESIRKMLSGKVLLVTGAGGSIGSEVVRQMIKYEPRKVVALDIDETDLFNLQQELIQKSGGENVVPVVADVGDWTKIQRIFEAFSPGIVLNAAAYKHVPMMESYPEEAVRVNVLGTMNLLNASIKYHVERFVMISTDKAINPSSVMGATKRTAEELVRFYNSKNHARFISVRFGNVVGSRGSVIPIFQKQIVSGGPVTVTHKDMKRYFMSIPEAVILVLQAAASGTGGEIFLLDMGEPVRILTVAEEMIRLHGLAPDKDIPIIFTGMRPGEKLYEDLMTPLEKSEQTAHPKIFKAINDTIKTDIIKQVALLEKAAVEGDKPRIIAILKEIIPAYNPQLHP